MVKANCIQVTHLDNADNVRICLSILPVGHCLSTHTECICNLLLCQLCSYSCIFNLRSNIHNLSPLLAYIIHYKPVSIHQNPFAMVTFPMSKCFYITCFQPFLLLVLLKINFLLNTSKLDFRTADIKKEDTHKNPVSSRKSGIQDRLLVKSPELRSPTH